MAVSIALGETIGEKRRQIGDALKVSKGKRAQLALICQDTIVSNNPRSTIKKFGLHNGGVLEMSGLTGGAKLRMEQPSYTCTQTGRSTDMRTGRQTDRKTDRRKYIRILIYTDHVPCYSNTCDRTYRMQKRSTEPSSVASGHFLILGFRA